MTRFAGKYATRRCDPSLRITVEGFAQRGLPGLTHASVDIETLGNALAEHSAMQPEPPTPIHHFFGPTVVRAAFVLAMFGWGLGFYGPPIYLQAVLARTQWPVVLVSGAVTLHFLIGAVVVAQLPRLHRRLGLAHTVVFGALATAFGVCGWALAAKPWQLLLAACLSGAGWVTMGAAAINAIIGPWYAQGRPMDLAKAYNGASIGGLVFLPLWSLLIGQWGFAWAAL